MVYVPGIEVHARCELVLTSGMNLSVAEPGNRGLRL